MVRLARNIPTVPPSSSSTVGIAVADEASDAFALGGTEGGRYHIPTNNSL